MPWADKSKRKAEKKTWRRRQHLLNTEYWKRKMRGKYSRRQIRDRESLHDRYIRDILNQDLRRHRKKSRRVWPPEIIALKRAIISLKRAIGIQKHNDAARLGPAVSKPEQAGPVRVRQRTGDRKGKA